MPILAYLQRVSHTKANRICMFFMYSVCTLSRFPFPRQHILCEFFFYMTFLPISEFMNVIVPSIDRFIYSNALFCVKVAVASDSPPSAESEVVSPSSLMMLCFVRLWYFKPFFEI